MLTWDSSCVRRWARLSPRSLGITMNSFVTQVAFLKIASDEFHRLGALRIGLGSRASILLALAFEIGPYSARLATPHYLPTPGRRLFYQLATFSPFHISHSHYGFLILRPVLQLTTHPYQCLDAYKKRTKSGRLQHPLVTEPLSCRSPNAILVVLQQRLQGLGQSQRNDERWTRWLDPTVNVVLYMEAVR